MSMPSPETSRWPESSNNRQEVVNKPYNTQEVQKMYHRESADRQQSNTITDARSLLAAVNNLMPRPLTNAIWGWGDLSKYIGITEWSDPKLIAEFHKSAGLTAGPETPWCMSFVQHVLRKDRGLTDAQIGAPTASAADGLNIGQPVAQPSPGDIVVVPGEGPSGKHIGIASGPGMYISGNTGNKVAEKPIPGGAEYRHVEGGAGASMWGQQMMA